MINIKCLTLRLDNPHRDRGILQMSFIKVKYYSLTNKISLHHWFILLYVYNFYLSNIVCLLECVNKKMSQ